MPASDVAKFVLTVACPETRGIVRSVSDFLYQEEATITEAAQHRDPVIDQFFMRVEFEVIAESGITVADLNDKFAEVARKFSMTRQFHDMGRSARILLAVSKHGHCLNDILHRWDSGLLPAEIVAVVSNHEDLRGMAQWYKLPFHYLPVSADVKSAQERQLLQLMEKHDADVLALARYMQILSTDLCTQLPGRIINIHHSFLPGFKGADPYRQAYNRGVKIIGATAHYVTADLDEGPIIEQAVEKIDHNCDIDELRQIGRDAECVAFARALRWHCEHRIIINGSKTIVFK
ncbi:MAG: formyltetrahydrofolate deformylase [Proteobacteria bacterium]|nr:formyltetrahydrofolate deformylase [Pseudomonadota bacterium]